MREDDAIQIIFAPEGYLFEVVYRSRGIPFCEGVFHQLALGGGQAWAVDFECAGTQRPASWRPLDLGDRTVIGICRDPAAR